MRQPEAASRQAWAWAVAFAIVLASEVIWYPELASFVSRDILKQGDAGYEILYYRDVYVLPVAVALGIVIAAAAMVVRRRRHLLIRVLWVAWGADLALLCYSLWRYFTHMAAAERYHGL